MLYLAAPCTQCLFSKTSDAKVQLPFTVHLVYAALFTRGVSFSCLLFYVWQALALSWFCKYKVEC